MRDEGWVKPLFSVLVAATFGFAVWWWFWHLEANPFGTEAMRHAVVAIIGLAVVALFLGLTRSISGTAATLGLLAAVLTASFGWQYREVFTRDVIAMDRNFYGTVRVRQSPDGTDRKLTHGVILHGQQFLDADRRRWPTTYYSSTSGAGVALEALRQARKRPLKVGLIGLGVGTLATWGQPGDQFRFYEINPQVIELAQRDFTYLKDSRATVTTALGDARLVLEREAPQGFDLLVVDAFTSDAIPVHLVTQEAMATYARQLAPGGIVAFHVSNRYLDLVPVVAGIAAANTMGTVKIADERAEWYLSRTDYVLATPDPKTLALKPIAERAEAVVPRAGFATWTDDYNNLFAILKR
jgi:SAM-dependent methyltransferase